MAKAKRMMQDEIKLVDLIIELVDARIPQSSRNPDMDELGKNKSRLIVLNKSDLSAEKANVGWESWFSTRGIATVRVDARSASGVKAVYPIIQEVCRAKIERDRRRGILHRPIRAMVAGIPNVGKSTFINAIAGRSCTKTGNRPGVTKGKQWVRLNKNVELLDTPGLLWPKFEDPQVGLNLAMVGSIRDEIIQTMELSMELAKRLVWRYPEVIPARYNIREEQDAVRILEEIARSRSCVTKGGEADLLKAAGILLEDFRSGRLGRITLELPEDYA
jgi:ribosome biogenesis GTPase A